MEDKIGEIVTLLPFGIKVSVEEIKGFDCKRCYYYPGIFCSEYQNKGVLGYCSHTSRKDRKNIIYKPLSAEEKGI